MAKKINLNGVKDFLFNHGEKVALGTCGFLALLFGSLGFMDAMSAGRAESGKPWADELKVRHDEIMRSLSASTIAPMPEQTKKMLDPKGYDWPLVTTDYQPQAYINVGDRPDNLRQNPPALGIRSGPKGNRLDYVPALFYTYETFLTKPEVKVLDIGGAVNAPAFGQKKGPGAPNMAGGGGIPFLRAGDPRRLIVGHAVFPLKDQVIAFQRALKYPSQKDMFDAPREDLPVFAGFDLIKHDEFLPNGEPTDKHEVLLMWNPVTEKLDVSPRLTKFLSVAVFDEKNTIAIEPYVFSGLTMPLPQLAFGSYPRVSFPGIEGNYDEEGNDVGPMKKGPGERPKTGGLPGFGPGKKEGGGGKQPAMEKDGQKQDITYDVVGMKRAELKAGGAFEQALDSRLFDSDFNIFHALGLIPAPPADPAAVNPNKGIGARPGPGGGAAGQNDRFVDAWDIKTAETTPDSKQTEVPVQPKQPSPKGLGPRGPGVGGADAQGPPFPNYARDAIVRFIDVDAEPGKKYQYRIRIRLKNPNYGKTNKDIAFANLAKDKEIVSAWVATEAITIPNDYHLYAIDQQLLDEGKVSAADAKVKDATWFQIHQWTKTPVDQALRIGYPIGDWAVAERVLVHRGEAIGRDALVNIPFWVKEKDIFDVKKNPGAKPGIKINMDPPIPANAGGGIVGDSGLPVLIDFTGGKRKAGAADEDVAVDALIVGPDGKLRVLNSRDAAENTPLGRERNARVVRARQRVDEALGRTSTATPSKKAGGLPGFGN